MMYNTVGFNEKLCLKIGNQRVKTLCLSRKLLFLPGFHTPGKVKQVVEMKALYQSLYCYGTSDTLLAVNDHRLVFTYLVHMFKKGSEGK